jgi:hypothetical protein
MSFLKGSLGGSQSFICEAFALHALRLRLEVDVNQFLV